MRNVASSDSPTNTSVGSAATCTSRRSPVSDLRATTVVGSLANRSPSTSTTIGGISISPSRWGRISIVWIDVRRVVMRPLTIWVKLLVRSPGNRRIEAPSTTGSSGVETF